MKRLLIALVLFTGIATAKKDRTNHAPVPAAVQNDPCRMYYKAQKKEHVWQDLRHNAHYQELGAAFQEVMHKEGWRKAFQSPESRALNMFVENYFETARKNVTLAALYPACKMEQDKLGKLFREFNTAHPIDWRATTQAQWKERQQALDALMNANGFEFFPRYGYVRK
jgi:hypothetical protein